MFDGDWILLAVAFVSFVFLATVLLGGWGVPGPRRFNGRCANCDYDLEVLGSRGVCPECGQAFDRACPPIVAGGALSGGIAACSVVAMVTGITLQFTANVAWVGFCLFEGHSLEFALTASRAEPRHAEWAAISPWIPLLLLTALAAAAMRHKGVRFGFHQLAAGVVVLHAALFASVMVQGWFVDWPAWEGMDLVSLVTAPALAWTLGRLYARRCELREQRVTAAGSAANSPTLDRAA